MRDIRLLVADDEATVRLFIQAVIRKEALPVASVAEAETGAEAVRLAAEVQPDLIFLDIRMPGVDGLAAARAILEAEPTARVVMVSAYEDFEYARTAFRAGALDYLLKPVRPEEVAAIIRATAEKCGAAEQSPELVAQVAAFVTARLGQPIRLGDIARGVFVSPSYLSRTFKQLTGQTLGEYVQDQRLAKAEELLTATSLSVTEVAAQVGFNDSTYFSTCFKRRTGVPPLQFRRRQESEGL